MIGRTPASIRAIRPLRHGVIADFEITEEMLRHFISQGGRGQVHVRAGRSLRSERDHRRRAPGRRRGDASAGARTVYLIEEPMAAAIGAGLPVADAVASMVIDIGGGTTEVAVIALGGMVVWESIRVGGYEMDEAIVDHVEERRTSCMIGQETAEAAKIEIGSAWPTDDDGRDVRRRSRSRHRAVAAGRRLRALTYAGHSSLRSAGS